jgi:protein-S-isoprenylcysteine O-methyltransferase Ste14
MIGLVLLRGTCMLLYLITLNLIVALFIVLELSLFTKDRLQGKGITGKDKGSVYWNFLSIALGITAAGLISIFTKLGFHAERSVAIFWTGISIMCLGLALRIWAVTSLGKSFRTTVEIHEYQKLVRTGPYKLIRHPSYAGLLLICVGYGIAVQNYISLVVAFLFPFIALMHRMHIEETLFLKVLGAEYAEYQSHTKKLIPWIW